MEFSEYQKKIFEVYDNTRKNIVVNAAPGSGKSFTLNELVKRTPEYKSILVMAFNKSIQKELRDKLPEHVDVYTYHGMGFRVLSQHTNKNYCVNDSKSFKIFYPILAKKLKEKKAKKLIPTIIEYSNIYRMSCCNSIKELKKVLDEREVFYSETELKILKDCLNKLEQYNTESHDKFMIDFIDMLEMPLKLLKEKDFPKYQIIMLDESQDQNNLQKTFWEKFLKKGSRFVAVGDFRQAIYGFMGADSSVFESLKSKPNTIELPLSVSYRCPKKIVEKASLYFDGVEAHEDNIEGEVRCGDLDEVQNGDFVICRNNLPLFKAFIYLLTQGRKVHILGKDLQDNIRRLTEDFILNGGRERRSQELLFAKIENLKNKGVTKQKKHPSYRALKELIDITMLLLNHFGTESNLQTELDFIFNNDDNEGVTLMTGHKSKGLEANRVFWLMPQLIPSEYVRTERDLEQEKSLAFVIITRAKEELIMVKEI